MQALGLVGAIVAIGIVTPETELKGYKLPKQLDPGDHHVRATIVVIDADKRVLGFIPHPEEVPGIIIAP